MAEVGRDLRRSPGPTLCSSRATQSQLPSTMSIGLLNISKDGDSAVSLGNLCQCSVTLTVIKCFLMFRGNLLCFRLCPRPLFLALNTTGKSLAPFSLQSLFRYLYTLIRSHLPCGYQKNKCIYVVISHLCFPHF